MRNSFLPVIAMVLVAVAALALIRPGSPRGAGGPDLFPGIYRLGKREVVPSLPSGELVCTTTITSAQTRDRRTRLAADAWDQVVIAAEDTDAACRTLVLALAEELTRRGCVAVIDTPDNPQPIPIPSDRRLRVSTLRDAPPGQPGGQYQATLRVVMHEPRPDDDHPAARLLPGGGIREVELTVEHRSHQPKGVPPPWDRWYATVGRSMAVEVIAALAQTAPVDAKGTPTPPATDWHGLVRADWPQRLPEPPQRAPARWLASFQHDLVRGWIGGIRGATHVSSATGATEPAIAPFARQLDRGAWKETTTDGQPLRLWTREADGERTCISALPNANGWDLVLWQERPAPAQRFADWQQEAERGDALARWRLGAHLACVAIPADLRAAATTWLAAHQPDLIEQAQLPGEATPAVAWLAADLLRAPAPTLSRPGVPALVRGQPWSGPARPTALSIDGQALWLLVRGATPGLVVLAADATAGRPRLVTLPVDYKTRQPLAVTASLANGALAITRTADAITVVWR